MAHFPDTPSFTGFNTPSRIEADIVNLAHPFATIDIPIRMRFGLHGNWAHAADIGLVA